MLFCLLLVAYIAACFLIDDMDSVSNYIYFTKGCITLASSWRRLVSHIFIFNILSATNFFSSYDTVAGVLLSISSKVLTYDASLLPHLKQLTNQFDSLSLTAKLPEFYIFYCDMMDLWLFMNEELWRCGWVVLLVYHSCWNLWDWPRLQLSCWVFESFRAITISFKFELYDHSLPNIRSTPFMLGLLKLLLVISKHLLANFLYFYKSWS